MGFFNLVFNKNAERDGELFSGAKFFGKLRKYGVDPDDFDSVVVKFVQENSERIDFIVSNTGELVGFEFWLSIGEPKEDGGTLIFNFRN